MLPATPAIEVSLGELADLAIGTPEVGAVNFTVLHTLIMAMLKKLNLQEAVIDFQALSPEGGRSVESLRASSRNMVPSVPQAQPSKDKRKTVRKASPSSLETQVKDLGGQVEDLTKQINNVDSQRQVIIDHVHQMASQSRELDFEHLMVKEVKSTARLDTLEVQTKSTPKAQKDAKTPTDLFYDVVEDVKMLKEAYQNIQELKPQELSQRMEELEKQIRECNGYLEYMGQKLTFVPSEEVTMVTWEELEQAIAHGWKASQTGSEIGLSKCKLPSSPLTSSDLIQNGFSTKHTSTETAPDSAGGSESSAMGYLYEGPTRAYDEASVSRIYQPPIPQPRKELDYYRSKERFTPAYPRRDTVTGPAQQDLPLTKDQPIGQGQDYPRSDHHELGLLGMDQIRLPYPSTTPPGVIPINVSQFGMLPPQIDGQEVAPLAIDQCEVVPPLVPGRNQERLGPTSTDQLGVAPLGIYQQLGGAPLSIYPQGIIPPGRDQHSIEQPGMHESGIRPLGIDQHGSVVLGMDQQRLVPSGGAQQRLEPPGTDQHGLSPVPTDGHRLVSSGLIQVSADQQGFVQPGLAASGFIQPGTEQHDLLQPDRDQSAFWQPGTRQPGLVQPQQHGLVQPDEYPSSLIQPGQDQDSFIQPGMDHQGLIQPGTVQHGLMQPGVDQLDVAQYGTDQCGLLHPDKGQYSLKQPGPLPSDWVQPDAYPPGWVQPGTDSYRLVQPGLLQSGAGQKGFLQPGIPQHRLPQPGIDQHGLVQPSADQQGLPQPGMDQRGLVQPSADQPGLPRPETDRHGLVQPSADQPGLPWPGMDRHGLVQPSADQPGLPRPGMDRPSADQQGLAQPGMDRRVLLQPGAGPRELVQPGTYIPRLAQPGTYPPSLVQSGLDQRGWRQPRADQQGLMRQGTEWHRFPTFQSHSRSLRAPYPYQHVVVPPGQEQHSGLSLLASQGLLSPRTDTLGLVPRETHQQDLMRPGTDMQSPAPVSTDTGSEHPDQQYSVSPGLDQQGQVYPSVVQAGQVHPGWGQQGPVYPGQVALDPNKIPHSSAQTEPGQDAGPSRSQDSISFPHRGSLDRSEPRDGTESERRDSQEKLAPSFPMALGTFHLIGELIGLYVELKEHLSDLDDEKAGQTDSEKIQYLFTLMVKKILPPDLMEQLKTLKSLAKEVQQEKAKVENLQRLLEGDSEQGGGKEMKADQLALQLGLLRIAVTDIEKELADLRDSQEQGKAALENSVVEASLYLQDQLDKLRTIIENMLASSSTLLSLSMSPHKPLTTMTPGQIAPEATCPACSLDLSHHVSTLVQRYEQLQDMVNTLAASQPSKKAKLQSQDEELLGHMQRAILKVQGDCEKLNITTGRLIEDHRRKQKDIDVLYQGLEKLKKEKADRENLQMKMDVKADKSALASKVSWIQFDATTEQLNNMMRELMAKMSGQEQDWQKLLDRLLAEMDMKLDRLELDPVKQALEDRWKSLREQLKERPPLYQADEAAALRRQLLAHFHCLSCDRPLETPVTGQVIPVTPVAQALPGHHSSRPYTVFELEQVRQQSRNLKVGGTFARADQSLLEQSVGRLHTMHSKMLLDIEKVQIHFGGSVRASSQMIHELLQSHCLSYPCYKRASNSVDYTYSTTSRRCGGSHTLTQPYRRTRLQPLSQGLNAPEEVQTAMKHDEVDILGLDGHIYKGRMDTRLPGILTKDTAGKHKPKQSRPQGHRQQPLSNTSQLPFRPQSAQMLAGNNSVSSRQQKDRPVSSEGRLAQSDMAHAPSPNLQGSLPGPERNMDMPPQEGLKEPTRGPRSEEAQ